MSAERLFDPQPFSDPHTRPRDERVKVKHDPPPVIEVVIGETWKVLANGSGAHAVQGYSRAKLAIVTYCNAVVGATLTVPDGTRAGACPTCIAHGAPHRGVA